MLVEADHLQKSYPGVDNETPAYHVIQDVSLSVSRGEMVTIVGPSGSGKSTLLYCLSGLEDLDLGRLVIDGTDLAELGRTGRARFRRDRLGFVFQAYNLIPYLTAFENIALPRLMAGRRVSDRLIDRALEQVGLLAESNKLPGMLSGGQQQRVAIARALANTPDVLYADEPTGALDTASGARVLQLLREYARGDRSVVMVTHDLEAAALGDRVLILRDGRINEELHSPSPRDVLNAVERAGS